MIDLYEDEEEEEDEQQDPVVNKDLEEEAGDAMDVEEQSTRLNPEWMAGVDR